jgi:HAD superfamily hydrolase (TIGR01509 family)
VTRIVRAVSFDFGQTLASLDPEMLAGKLQSRAVGAEPAALAAALPVAWAAYDASVRRGEAGHPWKLFMRTLLGEARVEPAAAIPAAVDFLWEDQPHRNLWRKPVPGMIELCRSLRARGVPLGILTNSEGRAAELLVEIGWAGVFDPVVDSGRVGVEKPARAIFVLMAERLGVPIEQVVHVGDSLGADIQGALGAGMRAIWFTGRAADAPAGVPVCHTADELRAALDAMLVG